MADAPERDAPKYSEMLQRLAVLEADERLNYKHADTFSNVVLALIQTDMRREAQTLRWVLGLPHRQYHQQDAEPSEVPALLACDV